MANTYTQIHLQLVFVAKFREQLINPSWKNRLYKFITGIVQHNGHKLIIINGVPDHIHMLIGMRPSQSLSELMQDIKRDSSAWINKNKLVKGRFAWQEGYAAFSYSKSELQNVINYINSQEEHHKHRTFKEEYIELLNSFEVVFEEKYLFETEDTLV
jgi:REP element-mobilizing transposase RayT